MNRKKVFSCVIKWVGLRQVAQKWFKNQTYWRSYYGSH